jgi:hypothetical protein
MNIVVKPPEKDAKLHRAERGRLFTYVGRLTVATDTMTVVPCRGITDRDFETLLSAPKALSRTDCWVEGPDGLTTYVSVRVDVDKAIARALAETADL